MNENSSSKIVNQQIVNGNSRERLLSSMWIKGSFAFALWLLLYSNLLSFSRFFTYQILGMSKDSHLASSLEFFVFETPKVLMLLVIVVFFVGIIRSFFSPENTRRILADKSKAIGNILAAGLGIFTPFCSCSAVPLFIGFVTAGVPLGITFSFLISAPMVNEIAVVLLFGLFGWKVALLYMSMGLLIAIVSGWIMGELRLEKYVEGWVYEIQVEQQELVEEKKDWLARINYGKDAVREIVGKVWIYVVLGIAVGAGIHGYVPQDFMASIMGKEAWWSVPVAVLIGIPMYSNAAGIIPIVQALLEKGAALGTVLAFMMAVIALSLPEMIILRNVLKPQLIAVFITVVGTGIILIGYLFNSIF